MQGLAASNASRLRHLLERGAQISVARGPFLRRIECPMPVGEVEQAERAACNSVIQPIRPGRLKGIHQPCDEEYREWNRVPLEHWIGGREHVTKPIIERDGNGTRGESSLDPIPRKRLIQRNRIVLGRQKTDLILESVHVELAPVRYDKRLGNHTMIHDDREGLRPQAPNEREISRKRRGEAKRTAGHARQERKGLVIHRGDLEFHYRRRAKRIRQKPVGWKGWAQRDGSCNGWVVQLRHLSSKLEFELQPVSGWQGVQLGSIE